MHIKQVIIQGFKSYKDQTVVEPFSRKHNVVVGRNGSGKSNFFSAIRFVLSDLFTNAVPLEQRQALLHEGTGLAVMSAFVEIIFDNTDNRFPLDNDEVVLRRTIGLKKDEYFLNKKHTTKNDVMNMLESAGFSRSNPYYIVQQGKINALTTAKDSERLQLLKEVAGTSVFDEKREESLKILGETQAGRESFDETLEYIDNRLEELEGEKEDLQKFLALDKKRRSIEYTIYDKEMRKAQDNLTELDHERVLEADKNEKYRETVDQDLYELETNVETMKKIQEDTRSVTGERTRLQDERQDLVMQKAQLALDVEDLEKRRKERTRTEMRMKNDVKAIVSTVESKTEELEKLVEAFDKESQMEAGLRRDLEELEGKRDALYAKQGRTSQFKTKKERDQWLKGQLKTLDTASSKCQEEIDELNDVIETSTKNRHEKELQAKEIKNVMTNHRQQIEAANKRLTEFKTQEYSIMESRKSLHREQTTFAASAQQSRQELRNATRKLRSSVNKGLSNGLDSVTRIREEHDIPGIYGELIDLFTVPANFATAVEVTAGNSLFNIVVDTDATAQRVLREMNTSNLPGRVTFMPLNRMWGSKQKFPESSDFRPMIDQLKFDTRFEPAMRQVFGRTLVCRSIEVALEASKQYDLDCITLHGDQANRQGALRGGFVDLRLSKMAAQEAKQNQSRALEEVKLKLDTINQEIDRANVKFTQLLGEREKTSITVARCRSQYDSHEQDLLQLKADISQETVALEVNQKRVDQRRQDLKLNSARAQELRTELHTELETETEKEDKVEIARINERISGLQNDMMASLKSRTQLENKKNKLDALLNSNLLRRERELKQELDKLSMDDLQVSHETKQTELLTVEESMEAVKVKQNTVERQIEDLKKEEHSLQLDIDRLQAVRKERESVLHSQRERLDKVLNRRALLLQKKESSLKQIRQLGSLPADATSKYKEKSVEWLYESLSKVNRDIKKCGSVNKKALDQYISFTEQREALTQRKGELDTELESIDKLIESLNMQKDEAIHGTFQQVTVNFRDVFKELVPNGFAKLTMIQANEEEIRSQQEAGTNIEHYTGVSVSVSFTGGRQDSQIKSMIQLSGGQKALVALTLIFAIQRCDPAPFYLFDEVDQALDAVHRTAVAKLVHKQSETAQYVTTTFRPEMLERCDKCYGVTHKNKVSHIDCISKEHALEFVEQGQEGGK